jgi:hypothetical protein
MDQFTSEGRLRAWCFDNFGSYENPHAEVAAQRPSKPRHSLVHSGIFDKPFEASLAMHLKVRSGTDIR